MNVKISIGIVLYNSIVYLPNCFHSIFTQNFRDFEVIAVDNNSLDDSLVFIKKEYPSVKTIKNNKNYGFSYAHNQAIEISTGENYLCLNPDVILSDNFLKEILKAIQINRAIGIATGKIYCLDRDFVIKPSLKTIDSTGIYLTRNMRHFDRGNGEEDIGQYVKKEYVFGATGACCLLKREMLEDIKINGEYFDNDFFFSREDIDICWRGQIAGWKVIYTPSSIAYHLRTVLPEKRPILSPEINMHSVKNRYLLQIKNHTLYTYLKTFPYALFREFSIIVFILIKEHYSMKGIFFVLKNFKSIIKKRRLVMSKKRVKDHYLALWFRISSMPVDKDSIL